MVVRELVQLEIDEALKLVLNVFMKFEAPDYVDEGIITFRNYIANREFINKLSIYGIFEI